MDENFQVVLENTDMTDTVNWYGKNIEENEINW
jgi:hypothetical protein